VRAELIGLDELSEAQLGRWRELAGRAVEPNPFHEPEYVLPLARGLGQSADVHLLAVGDGDSWFAVLPVRAGPWHRIPLPAVSVWRGHVLYGLLGTPLVSADRTEAALIAMIDGMLAVRRTTLAGIDDVGADGRVGAMLADVLGDRWPRSLRVEGFKRPAVRRRPEFTYIEETLSAKRRKELRRLRRRLGEELGQEPVTVDRAGEGAAYEKFIALEAAGSKNERRTVLAANAGHARFFTDMCRAFAELGRLQVLCLEADGETIAMQVNLLAGDTVFGIKIAYDARWAAYSPGVQLEVEGIRAFHEGTGATLMDSCADPGNPMLNRLWPDRRELVTYAIPADGARGWAAAPALRAARRLREWNRSRRHRGAGED
jgi:CelD/BcsL family acetyltransferase involved in cellulose biosynthesis